MSEKSDRQAKALAPVFEPDANMDRIRDILFGSQTREYERRFAELTASHDRETTRIKSEVNERLEKFEAFLRKEFEQLNAKIQRERNDRNEAIDTQKQASASADRTLSEKITTLNEDMARVASELRQYVHDQSGDLLKRMGGMDEQFGARLNLEADRLRDDKVGRSDLSEMLTELALRINREFALPQPTAKGSGDSPRANGSKAPSSAQ